MRAQSSIYHVKCFTCTVCHSLLQTGDHFGIFDGKIYCRTDFENLQYSTANLNQSPNSNNSPGSINMISTASSTGTTGMGAIPSSCQQPLSSHLGGPQPPQQGTNNNTPGFDVDLFAGEYPPPLSHQDFPPSMTQDHQANGAVAQTKSRSRKRRQGETILTRPDQQWQIGKTDNKSIDLCIILYYYYNLFTWNYSLSVIFISLLTSRLLANTPSRGCSNHHLLAESLTKQR